MVSHANEPGLRTILGNLMYQHRKPDETIVLVSGMSSAQVAELREDHPLTPFHVREDRQDWGHEKRAEGLELVTGDFLGFFNDDDAYRLDYIKRMMELVEEGYDVAYCAWNSIPNCEFRTNSSTSGNYIVRTSLARATGYPGRGYAADGEFIEALKAAGAVIAPKIEDVLYFHNWQPPE